MDLMKLIKGTDIGDCVARLLFTWNADHPDAEKAKETFISAIKARMPQQARLNLSSAEKLSNSIDRYLIKNDTEMYAAVKIGSAMMFAALANRDGKRRSCAVGGREFHFGYSGRNCGRPRGTQRNHLFRKRGQGKAD